MVHHHNLLIFVKKNKKKTSQASINKPTKSKLSGVVSSPQLTRARIKLQAEINPTRTEPSFRYSMNAVAH